MSGQKYPWTRLSTFDLLKVRICDLKLDIREPRIQTRLKQLEVELAAKKIRFKPHAWISTSWFSPYGIPGFAIPFYLFHPRLCELEQKYIGEVEGGTNEWCMQLLRHETGHAIDNAFHLRKSKMRQALFGLSGTPYPQRYLPASHSKEYVRHLQNHYAQAHPDEDWAETFAVWLDPKSNWKLKYEGWSALKKLELLDGLLCKIAGDKPLVANKLTVDEAIDCKKTLKEYYDEKQQKYQKLDRRNKQRQYINDTQYKRWITM